MKITEGRWSSVKFCELAPAFYRFNQSDFFLIAVQKNQTEACLYNLFESCGN